jgi:hypothetical protein
LKETKKKKGIAPVIAVVVGCGCLLIFVVFLGFMGLAALGIFTFKNKDNLTNEVVSSGGGAVIRGEAGDEVEFVLTHYTPCTEEYLRVKPDCHSRNGNDTTATTGKVVYDPNSPMGFYVKYREKDYHYSVAVPYHNTEPVLKFTIPGRDPEMGAFFDDTNKIFVALDRFGQCANNPKALDVLADDSQYNEFFQRLETAGLVTGRTELNGCSPSQKPVVRGTLTNILEIGFGLQNKKIGSNVNE